jgi:hypothetical protein
MKPIRYAAALFIALLLIPSALAGRMIYDGREALREGVLYPCSLSEGECFLIDAQGNIRADDGYYRITPMVSDAGLRRFAALRVEGEEMRCYLLDADGTPLTDGNCEYIRLEADDIIFQKHDGLCGAYSWNGEILVKPTYQTLYAVGDGSFLGLDAEPWEMLGDMGIHILPDGSEDVVLLGNGNISWLSQFISGAAAASVDDGESSLTGLIGADGQWILPPEYEYIDSVGGGYFAARKNGVSGLIDAQGRIFLPFMYADISSGPDYSHPEYIAARFDRYVSVFEMKTMDRVFDIEDVNWCWFDENGLHAEGDTPRLYALDGTLLMQSDGDSDDDLYALRRDRFMTSNYDTYEYALKDTQGNVLLSGIGMPNALIGEDGFYALQVFQSKVVDSPYGYTWLDRHRGRYGLYDLDGNEILPPKYDRITPICQGLYAVDRGQWTGVVNDKNEWVLRRSAYANLMD